MSSRPKPPVVYGDCGSCGDPGAPVKCACKNTHYCDKECQRKDKAAHRKWCTCFLHKDIEEKCKELQVTKAQDNCCASDVATKERELAGLHIALGELLRGTHLVSNYPLSEHHYKQALQIFRRLAALAKLSGSRGEKIYIDNSIRMLTNLGHLYRQWRKRGDAIEAYVDALDSMRDNIIAHGSTPHRQETLASILAQQGVVYIDEYECQGREPDKSKCLAAQALVEEALAINRSLNTQSNELALDLTDQPDHSLNPAHRQERTADVLLRVACTYVNLEMFDKARSAVQEALYLNKCCHGHESAKVATCHCYMATTCSHQADAIRTSMVAQSSSCYSQGTRVRVEGLQNHPQHNGMAGVVIEQAGDTHVSVRLHEDSKQLRLRLANVCPLIATADERKDMYTTIRNLSDEEIASSKEFLRIQVKTKGAKHLNTAGAHHHLGLALQRTLKPAETREAVEMLNKGSKILSRVAEDDDPRLLEFSRALETAQTALSRFTEVGVLSALPCWWPPTSRLEDEAYMSELFAEVQDGVDSSESASMSSDAMQQELRMHGIFDFSASSSDPVSDHEIVAHLHKHTHTCKHADTQTHTRMCTSHKHIT